jgi:hypothetical protein
MSNSILWVMVGSEIFQRSIKVIVHRKGHLEDVESIGINVSERMLLLVLNYFLEVTDRLGGSDFEGKDVIPSSNSQSAFIKRVNSNISIDLNITSIAVCRKVGTPPLSREIRASN